MRQVSPTEIGARLGHIRGSGANQRDHAAALGIPLRTYQTFERGEREPDLRILLALADKGWSVHWLLTGQGPERLADLVAMGGGPAGSQPLKSETLTIALQLASEALEEKGLTLPTPKRAELVVALYELLEEGLPEAKVLRFARTAAA